MPQGANVNYAKRTSGIIRTDVKVVQDVAACAQEGFVSLLETPNSILPRWEWPRIRGKLSQYLTGAQRMRRVDARYSGCGYQHLRPQIPPALSMGSIAGGGRAATCPADPPHAAHDWHRANGAGLGNCRPLAGRPYAYPRNGEKHPLTPVMREVTNTRRQTWDCWMLRPLASSIVKGPDAGKFLDICSYTQYDASSPGKPGKNAGIWSACVRKTGSSESTMVSSPDR